MATVAVMAGKADSVEVSAEETEVVETTVEAEVLVGAKLACSLHCPY